MTIETIKSKIVEAVNLSKFQVDFIDNDNDGSLIIKVSRPTKHDHYKTISGKIREENDIGKFIGALSEN